MFIRRESFQQYIKMYPVVSTIIALNIIAHLVTRIPGLGTELFYAGVSHNGLIAAGEWWRMITSMFLHAGFLHILFNMFSLFLFGPELEKIAGKMRFLTIYFLAGIFGGIVTFVTQDADYASVGASGAIFGIIGAFGGLLFYMRHVMPQLRQIILPIIVISVIMTFLQPNINIASHLGGLVTGFALGLFYFKPKNMLRWRQ
ncbi:rhomboid family intramembrane serine protease [Metasolibacillus sp. FSL H7-0170]|uniref:rhomboid family intramembrane serine protease n=1 Tax=Metasolibacillus TaxID=2703677 RepID=UPI000D33E66B|nr:rhomboid family intramembrane serine protease [Metasolibacillus fluoroglycofenilyticus]